MPNRDDNAQLMTSMDEMDARILQVLSRDGRISNLALAERVGLSPSACLRRVAALEKAGVIQGYRAVLSPEKTGVGFVAYVTVGLGQHTKAAQQAFERAQQAFERAMEAAPQVRECHNITGAVEYLLRVEAESLTAYKHFHTDILGALPQVNTLQTFVVMGSSKDARA